jgi:hypothetical protein
MIIEGKKRRTARLNTALESVVARAEYCCECICLSGLQERTYPDMMKNM